MWILNYNYILIFITVSAFLNHISLFKIIKLFIYILLVLYNIL